MALAIPVHEVVERSNSPLLSVHDTWERVLLHEVAAVQNGFAFPSSQFSNGEDGVPLIRIRDILNSTTEATFTGGYEDAYIVQAGDLLVGMDGDFNSARWRGPKGLLNQRVCRVTVDPCHYDLAFLAYALPGYLDAINEFTSSITVKHLSSRSVEQIPLPLPPLTEQRRIVASIEEQFSRLDTGVATLERVRTNLERYRTAVLKAAVEGRLTETWREENPDVGAASELLERILKERRERWEKDQLAAYEKKGKKPPKNWQSKYKEPTASNTSDLPEVPEGWGWSTLDVVLSRIEAGKSFKCDERPPEDDEVGVVKVSAVTWGEFDQVESKTCTDQARVDPDLLINEGDFLFSRANTLALGGACVIVRRVDSSLMLSDKILRMHLVGISQQWLLLALRTLHCRREIERLATGNQNSMRNISQENIRRIRIPIPPLVEQKAIVEEVKRRFSVLDEVEAEVAANLKRAARLRQAILKRAFEGKLVPQDPTDEPASELLARIRADRERSGSAKRRKKGPAQKGERAPQPSLFSGAEG